jgi:hypothetical protein
MNQFLKCACASVLFGTIAAPALGGGGDPCGQWDVVPTPNPPDAEFSIVRGIKAISPDDVWAVGGYYKTVGSQIITYGFSMHWDGASWTDVPTPQPSPCPECTNVTLWGVDAIGPNDVWACGDKYVQGPAGFLGSHMLVMHWNGSSWTVMNTPLLDGGGDILFGVEAIAPNDVWFFGDSLNQTGSPDLAIALHFNGSSFELVNVPSVNPDVVTFGDGNGLRAGSALAPNDVWAVGAASDGDSMPAPHSQIQHWNGSTWQNVPGPSPGVWHDLNAVVAIAPDDVWAGGDYFDGTAYHGLALHYDGTSWTQVPIPGGVSDLVAFASDDVYAAGAGIMHWDGTSWTVMEDFATVDGPSFAGLSAAGPCDLWAAGRQFLDGTLLNLTTHLTPTVTAGDINHDGAVNIDDLFAVIAAWGDCPERPAACAADLDNNGVVDIDDLFTVIGNWS